MLRVNLRLNTFPRLGILYQVQSSRGKEWIEILTCLDNIQVLALLLQMHGGMEYSRFHTNQKDCGHFEGAASGRHERNDSKVLFIDPGYRQRCIFYELVPIGSHLYEPISKGNALDCVDDQHDIIVVPSV